ncbi:MAG: oligogalacturonate lyase family protein [Bryobacterales bacterium]|nr:oligogalacturonate lyase family protein [Bryobacterales bacterium]
MRRVSRRCFLAAASAQTAARAVGRGTRLRVESTEFQDGLTGRDITRLTDSAVLHHLPGSNLRCVARNNAFVLVAAEHGGVRQFHRLDLKRERLVQLTEGEAVHPYAAHLRRNDRGFYYLQGNELLQADIQGGGRRRLFACPDGWTLTGDLDISGAERYAALIEMAAGDVEPTPEQQFAREPHCRVRIVEISRNPSRGKSWVAAEERRWLSSPRFRPWRSQLLYAREGPWRRVRRRLQLVNLDGSSRTSLRPATGAERLGASYWAADGARLRFVHFPDGEKWTAGIRSIQPETREETADTPCSGFDWMTENADGTAIIGASRRPSGPNIYVLFPRMRREITLCEHLSSLKPYPLAGTDRSDPHAAAPAPALAPDSAAVYFSSDWEGLPAVYRMPIDDLVETMPG